MQTVVTVASQVVGGLTAFGQQKHLPPNVLLVFFFFLGRKDKLSVVVDQWHRRSELAGR